MIAKARARFIRITPRKFRQVIPLIKGKNPEEAIAILMNIKKKASLYAIELVKSALANAKRANQGLDVSTLYISGMKADCGPTLKRFRAASMGRASSIRKRTSHLTVELDVSTPPKDSSLKENRKAAHDAKSKENIKKKKPETRNQ